MKSDMLKVGDKVRCSNSFGCVYTITEKFNTVCTLSHKTGEKVMKGGKWVDEEFTYKGIRYSMVKEIV